MSNAYQLVFLFSLTFFSYSKFLHDILSDLHSCSIGCIIMTSADEPTNHVSLSLHKNRQILSSYGWALVSQTQNWGSPPRWDGWHGLSDVFTNLFEKLIWTELNVGKLRCDFEIQFSTGWKSLCSVYVTCCQEELNMLQCVFKLWISRHTVKLCACVCICAHCC